MSNNIKQIYVSLELRDNELKLLVSEYYNTRFNVIRVSKVSSNAINDFKIVDHEQLKNDIKKLVNDTEKKLSTTIEAVILVIPAYNFKRFPLKSKAVTDDGMIRKKDISRAISNSLKVDVDKDCMIVNTLVNKYNVNSISTRRIPEGEFTKEFTIDLDLLCADKQLIYDYVSIVEECGLKVLDITLNTFSICKEAALFEESLKQNLIVMDIGRSCTFLSLLNKGRLVSTEIVYDGLDGLLNAIYDKYHLSGEDIVKLVKYDVDYDSKYLDDVVYAYHQANESLTITKKELNDVVLEPLNHLVDKLITMCKPIFETNADIFITGEGQQMQSLVDKIHLESNVEVKSYYPDTIGVRDASLTGLYGSLFVYRDKIILNEMSVSCINLFEYDSLIDQRVLDTEGETITTKIKNLFKQYMEREEE